MHFSDRWKTLQIVDPSDLRAMALKYPDAVFPQLQMLRLEEMMSTDHIPDSWNMPHLEEVFSSDVRPIDRPLRGSSKLDK